ncbi:MAG TPA: DUF2254 family protein, partial [Candidatus Competibacteraceae bacterium]|nr:DUF2254 family protein [Candidatus Competibacteraceae bacterium]
DPRPVDPARLQAWNAAFTINRYRTTAQDAAFGLQQLVDIALKGLSPGINDTTTALMSLDYVTAILIRLAHRRIPSPRRYQEGVLRVIAPGPTFADVVAMAFDPIRQNAAGNVAALAHLLQAVDRLSHPTRDPQRRHALRRQASLILDTARQSIPLAADRDALESHGERLLRDLSPVAIAPPHGRIDLPPQER